MNLPIARRAPLVAARTLELEQGAIKHLSGYFGTVMLARLDSDSLAGYVARRKAEGAGAGPSFALFAKGGAFPNLNP